VMAIVGMDAFGNDRPLPSDDTWEGRMARRAAERAAVRAAEAITAFEIENADGLSIPPTWWFATRADAGACIADPENSSPSCCFEPRPEGDHWLIVLTCGHCDHKHHEGEVWIA
jgi:hypothetical protein